MDIYQIRSMLEFMARRASMTQDLMRGLKLYIQARGKQVSHILSLLLEHLSMILTPPCSEAGTNFSPNIHNTKKENKKYKNKINSILQKLVIERNVFWGKNEKKVCVDLLKLSTNTIDSNPLYNIINLENFITNITQFLTLDQEIEQDFDGYVFQLRYVIQIATETSGGFTDVEKLIYHELSNISLSKIEKISDFCSSGSSTCVGYYNPGKWTNLANTNSNMIPLVNINRVPLICDLAYCIKGGNNLLDGYEHPKQLRRTPHGIRNLSRFFGRVPGFWPIPNFSTSAWPLFVYYKSILCMGQHCMARELIRLLQIAVSYWKKFVRINVGHRCRKQIIKTFLNIDRHMVDGQYDFNPYFDDFLRSYLKCISGNAYVNTFRYGPAYMLFCHLHCLSAKSPFTKEQIVSDIDSWVSSDIFSREKDIDRATWYDTMNRVFINWTPRLDDLMSYAEYASDVMRWGTSGGAPKSTIRGETIKSKWAWGLSKLFRDDGTPRDTEDLLSGIIEHDYDDAVVALKEEPQKTREVIATPISSYIRQSYLLYAWGKPKIPSPISDSNWISIFERNGASWYGCIDGERFDHSIPAWVILDIVDRLGNLTPECRVVADEELKHLKELHVSWSDHRWKWKGGLLSGWRITALAGSLVSYVAATYILEKTNCSSACNIGIMGDDIVLYSDTIKIPSEVLVHFYDQFKLKSNLNKTVSGVVGEYLRKARSSIGNLGFPALGLRSIVYASAWISSFQYNSPGECSNNWLTYQSRLVPHCLRQGALTAFIYANMTTDLGMRFGYDKPWVPWVMSPASAGGGGAMHLSWPTWISLDPLTPIGRGRSDPYGAILEFVGIKQRSVFSFSDVTFTNHDMVKINHLSRMVDLGGVPDACHFKKSTNITKTIYRILEGGYTGVTVSPLLSNPIPFSARMLRGWKLANYLMVTRTDKMGMTTIFSTKECLGNITAFFDAAKKHFFMHRGLPMRSCTALVTVALYSYFSSSINPFGTW